MKNIFCKTVFGIFFLSTQLFAQAGMTVSPGKMYYKLAPGATSTQKVSVSNPNKMELQVGVSLSDWNYDAYGNNIINEAGTLKTSCSDWVQVMPGSYFTLQPGEQKELNIILNVPAEANTTIPVRTAMLFFTQLNPGDSKNQDGSFLKVSVRMGVKIYHSFTQNEERGLEILNFADKIDTQKKDAGVLELEVQNTGKVWLESKIKWELLNTQTGEKISLDDQESYSLPGDKRIVTRSLPADLKKGRYNATALVSYGNKDELKIAELEFER